MHRSKPLTPLIHYRQNNVRLPRHAASWTGHSTASPSMPLAAFGRNCTSPEPLQFTVALRLVSAAHLNGTSSLAADQKKHREPLHYTTDIGPVLHHATPTTVLPALFNTIPGPAANQLSQQAHQYLAASLHNGSLTNSQTH
jgi:hypothetical protein